MSAVGDAFGDLIKRAVREGLDDALKVDELTSKRLLSVKEAAEYLDASEHEIHNMIAREELPKVEHGRRVKLDRRDLDAWIQKRKSGVV